jgi:predicted chitinase
MTPATMLRAEMDRQGVTDPMMRAGIAAIAGGESGFSMKPEMGYAHTSNERIRMIFGSRVNRFSDSQLDTLKADEKAFFNTVYGGQFGAQQLGNTEPGDGFKFRGRGLFQLTGRANYARYSKMIGRDLLTDPEVANDPAVACAIAVAYMRDRYHGGGWEGMKAAVGVNVADIAATKDALFRRYMASGEFEPVPDDKAIATAAPAPAAAPVVISVSAVDRIKTIQTTLQLAGVYSGAIDGIWGSGSARGLSTLVNKANEERGNPA